MENRPPSAVTGPVTDAERTYAIDLLKTTQAVLHQTVAGLSSVQLMHKPSAERWSVAECVEHIVLVERGIFRAIQAAMSGPADADKRTEIRVSDVDVIKAVRSRSTLTTAPTPFVPTGRYGDTAATLAVFDQQRQAVIGFVETVAGDLRTHYFDHFMLGTLDLYQAILLIASHGERHRKQIDEVKAGAGFPQ
ncbi:MAG: DinB family protein [Bacteroidetes bacterium]|nr:DinB family protein [Fibrella sp.]